MRKLITLLAIVFTTVLQAQNKTMDEFVDGGTYTFRIGNSSRILATVTLKLKVCKQKVHNAL
ncbi:MAG: hypothetical protein LKE41_07675 [Prevotella sp.]|jgi:hypothetical protein|nr:hypothetical protein [Prevotella sp.]